MAGVVAALLLAFGLTLAFGWPLLRGTVERRLAAAIHRPVRIGGLARDGGTLLAPTLALTDVRVAHPDWVGRGDMLRVARARIRLPVLPLLIGRARPEAIAIDGLRLALVRDGGGRANWRRDPAPDQPSGAAPVDLGRLVLRDAIVSLDDAVRDRHLRARLSIDPTALKLAGEGTIAGAPARIAITGAGVAGQAKWPFALALTSSVLTIRARGSAALPLDLGHFTGQVAASGRDLRDLDRVIEAGLPGTQPFRLTATVIHDRPSWRIENLTGTIGRSDILAQLKVSKHGDRTLLEGGVVSNGFDFDDLATDAQLAQGAARARAIGPRLIPPTRIDLTKLRRTDAVLRFDLRRLLFKTPSAFRSVSGSLALDHGVLTVAPLAARLGSGRVTGSAIVRHQSGAPRLILDLSLAGGRIEEVFVEPGTAAAGLAGRVRLQGSGSTVRAAIGHASGSIAIVARDGTINRRAALIAGFDVGRALTAGGDARAPLRCLVARFEASGGIARPAPLILDTGVSRADGSGSVNLSNERLALSLAGRSKLKGGLRLDQPVRVAGIIKAPDIIAPPRATTAGGVLKMIGRAIVGKTPPPVADADCAGLAARALR